MKTRTVVHIALNSKNERVGNLVEVAGRFIPFEGWCFTQRSEIWACRSASEWINCDYGTVSTLKKWKKESAEFDSAVRFQRVTLIGETK